MNFEVMEITPEVAGTFLELNTTNYRDLDRLRVLRYAKDMKAGEWDLNGETIKLNGSHLIDGQHRLHAVIESGATIKSLVCWDVDCGDLNIDRGKPRTVAQELRNRGLKNFNIVATAARYSLSHELGLWGNPTIKAGDQTDNQVVKFAMKHHDAIQDAASLANKVRRHVRLSAWMLSSVLFLGSGKKSPGALAMWFADKLMTGSDLSPVEPVLLLRNRIIQQTQVSKMTSYHLRMLLTVAWNKTVNGETTKQLKLCFSGPTAQKPPEKVLVDPEVNVAQS